MKLFQSIPFPCEGTDYDIRILYDDRTINVVAFRDDHPANGYRHQVLIPKGCDAREVLTKHPVPELVQACKKDIEEGRWEGIHEVLALAQGGNR